MKYNVSDYHPYSGILSDLAIPTVFMHENLIEKIESLKPEEKLPKVLVIDKDDFITEEALPFLVHGTMLEPVFHYITKLGMEGKLDFRKSYASRINALKLFGYSSSDFKDLAYQPEFLLSGTADFIAYFDMPKIIVSGGVLEEVLETAALLGIDAVIANELGFKKDGRINGHHHAYVNGNKGEITKAIRKYFGFIYGGGDSATDIGIMENSDIFIAGPRSKEKLIAAASKYKNAIIVPKNKPLSYAIEELEKMKIKA
jgi:phosphoserine phosphatase